MDVLGVDIGGSGIKGAVVKSETGELATERYRIPTPDTPTPERVAGTVLDIARHFNWNGWAGVTFPGVIRSGEVFTAANIHPDWVGINANVLMTSTLGYETRVINDADAAGIAEMEFGVGRRYPTGVLVLLTVGTGIGSAVFVDGRLLPNTEFGHLQIRGKDAERRASDAARQRKNLTWQEWAIRFQEVLDSIEDLFWPDVIVIGGGISKHHMLFMKNLHTRAVLVPADNLNQAGILGAAIHAGREAMAGPG